MLPDSKKNRLRIVRFLHSEWYARPPHPQLTGMIERYAAHARVQTPVTHRHFTVRRVPRDAAGTSQERDGRGR